MDSVAVLTGRARLPAGLLGCATLFSIGWTGLLIPSLIRSIETTFAQNDAGIGVVYLVYAIAYAAGSFAGAPMTERVGRRLVLSGAAVVTALGTAGLGLASAWPAFVVAALILGAGAGCLDGGANGVVLDVYREGRGRAMNLLHASFAFGALAAPLIVGTLVERGTEWQMIAVVTGVAVTLLAVAYAITPMPSGRRVAVEPLGGTHPADSSVTDGRAVSGRLILGLPLVVLGCAIAFYVASEVGISNWLVRFLEPAPLTTATLALSLYWAGLTSGRLISSVISDKFDHLGFTIACAMGLAVMAAAAVLVPSLPLSIIGFAGAGIASGPIFPMIVAIGGERYPDRSAAVGGSLTGMAVIGSTIYPPAMGFLSISIGLTAAMFGNALLALGCVVALVAFGRSTRRPARVV